MRLARNFQDAAGFSQIVINAAQPHRDPVLLRQPQLQIARAAIGPRPVRPQWPLGSGRSVCSALPGPLCAPRGRLPLACARPSATPPPSNGPPPPRHQSAATSTGLAPPSAWPASVAAATSSGAVALTPALGYRPGRNVKPAHKVDADRRHRAPRFVRRRLPLHSCGQIAQIERPRWVFSSHHALPFSPADPRRLRAARGRSRAESCHARAEARRRSETPANAGQRAVWHAPQAGARFLQSRVRQTDAAGFNIHGGGWSGGSKALAAAGIYLRHASRSCRSSIGSSKRPRNRASSRRSMRP